MHFSILFCSGVTPRKLKVDGVDHPKVLSYIDVLRHRKKVGKKVAIIGQFFFGKYMKLFRAGNTNCNELFRCWWHRL